MISLNMEKWLWSYFSIAQPFVDPRGDELMLDAVSGTFRKSERSHFVWRCGPAQRPQCYPLLTVTLTTMKQEPLIKLFRHFWIFFLIISIRKYW